VFEATQTGENGKASAKDTFTVIDTTTPLAPSVNPVSDVQTQVTGTGAANHNITVAINGVTYTGTASGSGAYSVTIPKQTSGTKIEVTQTNPNNGNVSPKQSVTVSDTTLGAPSISEITEDNTQVTVTGQPNTSITLVLPTGSKMSLVSDATGKAIFTIPAAQENTTYQAYQTGANGKASPSASASVKSLPKSGTITANEFTIGVDISVTGTYTGDVKSVRLIYDGVEYRGGSVGSGSYSFYALSTIKDKTKTAKMYGYDKNGVKIAETVLSLRDTKDSGGIGTGSITATEFMINRDINITGTVTGDVVAVGLVYDGTEYRGGTVSNGNYSFYALSTVTDKTKTATMYGYDRNGNRIATAVVTLRDAKDPGGAGTGSITANDFTIHRDLNVTGTYTGDVVSLGLVYDGKEYRGGTVSNGTFSFYALNTIKDKTKTATMYGYDRNGNRIATTPIVLRDAKDPGRIGTGEIKTNEFTIHRDSNVTGTYTGDVVSLGLVYDGTEYRGGSLSNGTFSFYALNTIKDKTKTATMYGSDQNGNRIATDVISLRDAKDETISGTGTVTADNFVIGTSTRITGTFTGDVHSLIVKVGTTEYAGGTLDKATGTYSFYAWGKINSVSDDVTVYGINKQGARIATTPVVVTKPNTSGTITPNEFVIGQDSNLTATYTGDVKRVVVTINGVEHTGGTVSNGNVTFFIGNKIVSKNDTVNITAYDAYNQKLQEKIVTLKDISDNTSGTITPNLFLAGQDSDITATYTGDVKSIKVTINNQVYIGGTLSNGNASFWIGDKITSSGDEVFISAYDLNGKKLDEKPVEIKNINGDIHPDEYTVRKDTVLTANVTNAVRSVKVVINGVDYVGGTISGGRLSFWIGDKIKDSKDTVRIYAYDKNGRELDNKAVVLKDLTPEVGTLTPSVFSLKTSSVRGAYTGEGRSLRLTVNGTALQQGGTVSGGTFSYYVGLRDKIRSKTDVVQIELLDRYGLVMDTKNLTIID
ncbi:immunoglobulin-like domain-containing protein, partial [Listeria fleischmannii]